ncbi:hypothetical protein [Flavobacterium wongokense]|uniref:hypothetical protein n=1 Tax=Flavobacterium wongokense TaxID=2910674 RepID=UPI001F2A3C4A|nr:hypothetical protein [Flavobacterium sp. WG47]MCF6131165.1 hypothetical protein [Flavobacterium sp. WG47]
MKHLYILLFSISLFSQEKPLSFEIDKLTSIDSTTKRCFTLQYHIQNVSDKTVSFVLNGNSLIPINAGSQSEKMYYKLFENDKAIEMSNIIDNGFIQKIIESQVYENKSREEVEKLEHDEALRYFEAQRKKSILENIITLKPNETKTYEAYFSWNKERYRRQGDFEYYISETSPHFLQLDFNLMLEVFEEKLTPEEYKNIRSSPNIIKGWYTSNKVPIDFSE